MIDIVYMFCDGSERSMGQTILAALRYITIAESAGAGKLASVLANVGFDDTLPRDVIYGSGWRTNPR